MARTKQTARHPLGRSQLPPFLATPAPTDASSTASPAPTEGSIGPGPADDKPVPEAAVQCGRPLMRTFEQQTELDRKAAKNAIKKEIDRLKHYGYWDNMSTPARTSAVAERYKKLIEMRSKHHLSSSAKKSFPGKYDERAEIARLLGCFEEQIEAEDESEDDIAAIKAKNHEEGEDEDDEEAEKPEEQKVKAEGDDMMADPRPEHEAEGDQIAVASSKVKGEAANAAKRKALAHEQTRAGKKIKTGHGGQAADIGDQAVVSEDARPAPARKIVYTAVSRGVAISDVCRVKRDRTGWPWAKVGKRGALGG